MNEHTRCFIDCRHSRTPGNPGFVVASIVFLVLSLVSSFYFSRPRVSISRFLCSSPVPRHNRWIHSKTAFHLYTRSNRTLYLSPWKSFLHPSISLITLGRENMPWKMLRSTITVRIMFFLLFLLPPLTPLSPLGEEWMVRATMEGICTRFCGLSDCSSGVRSATGKFRSGNWFYTRNSFNLNGRIDKGRVVLVIDEMRWDFNTLAKFKFTFCLWYNR